ncbi:hypothetical protein CLU85_2734 [Acidovorax sp. 69]|nr:hypothetical protein CLU85_2734 [Acidovorax sp. 69]
MDATEIDVNALPTVSHQWVSYHRRGSINDRGSARGSLKINLRLSRGQKGRGKRGERNLRG